MADLSITDDETLIFNHFHNETTNETNYSNKIAIIILNIWN